MPLRHVLTFLVLATLPAFTVAAPAPDYATPYAFTTLAGVSSIGSADGPGHAARFFGPSGAATDAQGNIYISDHANNTIRKRRSPAPRVVRLRSAPLVRRTPVTTRSSRRMNSAAQPAIRRP